jgi:hypothetical protein
MRILVGVLANDEGGYSKMVDACRRTCYEAILDEVSVYYIYGHRQGVEIPSTYRVDDDCFYCNYPESRANILIKTLGFFEYSLANLDFDFIYRPNCGSYINLSLLVYNINAMNIKPKEVYWGVEGDIAGTKYASGSGFLISRDVVERVVAQKKSLRFPWNSGFIMDDVSLGELITKRFSIKVMPGAMRQDLTFEDIVERRVPINLDCYHFYFRHSIDPRCFYAIHKLVRENIK